MNARKLCWQVLVVLGLVAMLLGAFAPLEGSLLILPGSGLVALGALVGRHSQLNRHNGAFAVRAFHEWRIVFTEPSSTEWRGKQSAFFTPDQYDLATLYQPRDPQASLRKFRTPDRPTTRNRGSTLFSPKVQHCCVRPFRFWPLVAHGQERRRKRPLAVQEGSSIAS